MGSPNVPRQWGTTLPQRTRHMNRGNRIGGDRPVLTVVRDIGSAAPARKSHPRTGFTAKVKLGCRARAGGGDPNEARCESCGTWLGRDNGEIQHLDARGMGGTSLPLTDSIVNAALLCGSGALRTGCHGKCEDRHLDMHRRGFWLRGQQVPGQVKVQLWTRRWVYLLPDGTYGDEPQGGGAA